MIDPCGNRPKIDEITALSWEKLTLDNLNKYRTEGLARCKKGKFCLLRKMLLLHSQCGSNVADPIGYTSRGLLAALYSMVIKLFTASRERARDSG